MTEHFYKEESQRLLNDLEISDYLKHVIERIIEDRDQSSDLDCFVKQFFTPTIEKYFIGDHIDSILLKIGVLFDECRMNDLRQFYSLFSKVDGLDRFCLYFEKYIEKDGLSIVTNLEKKYSIIQDLINLKDAMDNFLHLCFQSDEKFVSAFEKAFKLVVNKRPSKVSELLAKHIHTTLQSGIKDVNEAEFNYMISGATDLLKYMSDKDIFKMFYQRDLSKRLLFDSCASNETEKTVVSKLKLCCGLLFAFDMEEMLKDIERSKTLTSAFNEHPTFSKSSPNMQLSVSVLSKFWPSYPETQISLPAELAVPQKQFELFCFNHNKRELKWHPFLSCCILKANFPKGTKELKTSLLQTVVLLLFNKEDCLTFEEIWKRTSINCGFLKRTLHTLACGKMKFLCQSPKSENIRNDDKFFYNGCFESKCFRINITKLQVEKLLQRSETDIRIAQSRTFQVDVSIVKIMKRRKSLEHCELIAELGKQLEFQPKVATLKMRIEKLIDLEYLERDPSKSNVYNYLP